MTIKIDTKTVLGGMILNRHYDDSQGSVDSQCGSINQWTQWVYDISKGLEYYWFGASIHKMFEKCVTDCFSPKIPFRYHQSLPGVTAYVTQSGWDRSNMVIQYFNAIPGENPYRWDGALSHEFGHVHHNWARCFHGAMATEFSKFWQRQITTNNSLFDATKSPWLKQGGGVEYPNEQYANAFRCYFGLPSTRGQSGPGTNDPVLSGFKDPKLNQAWCTQMKLLPETSAMIDTYGIKPDTLSWQWGDLGGWQFQTTKDGKWYAHFFNNSNFAEWYEWNGYNWIRSYPSYNRT